VKALNHAKTLCSSQLDTESGQGYSLHEFPIDDAQTCAKQTSCTAALMRWPGLKAGSSVLCEKHFTPECFMGGVLLKHLWYSSQEAPKSPNHILQVYTWWQQQFTSATQETSIRAKVTKISK